MGVRVPCAPYLTLGSFAVNFSTNMYDMLTRPSMKDIADAVSQNIVFDSRENFT